MGIVIRFPNREPEELKHDKDRDVEIIMGVVEDLAWPACCLLLTAVMLRCLERYCGTEIDPTCKFSPPQSRSGGISFYGFSAPRRFHATKVRSCR